MNTVKLFIERAPRHSQYRAPGTGEEVLTEFVPYVRGRLGGYVHRVRSGRMYFFNGELTHTAVQFWCGQTCFTYSKKRINWQRQAEYFDEIPKGAPVCSTCHGRAIGAGFDGPRMRDGAMLKFSPRV